VTAVAAAGSIGAMTVTVLIVDDHATLRHFARQLLDEAPKKGFIAKSAFSGRAFAELVDVE
jgi:hypothetical protein